MKTRKRRIERFCFFDHTHIARHLEKMAAKGWMLDKVTGFGWEYRAAEPKQLRFAVSYYPKASAFDPEPTEGERQFQDFCAHTGWQLACSSAQLQIFYNEDPDPTPIQTEPALELVAIHETAKKNLLPSHGILLGLLAMQLWLYGDGLRRDPIGQLSNGTQMLTLICFVLLGLESLTEIVHYFRWYGKAKKAVAQGILPPTMNTSRTQWLLTAAVWILAIFMVGKLADWIVNGDRTYRFIGLTMVVWFVLQFLLIRSIMGYLKKKKAPRGLNRTVTILGGGLLSLAMMSAIIFTTLKLSQEGMFAEKTEETYEYHGMTWVVDRDEIPLRLEDLLEEVPDVYSTRRSGGESFLLGHWQMTQRVRFDAESYKKQPDLRYNVTEVKLPALYDFCENWILRDMEEDYVFDRVYEPVDPAPWGALRAYQLRNAEYGLEDRYLLCYESTIVELWRLDWTPTAAQMATVGEKLG